MRTDYAAKGALIRLPGPDPITLDRNYYRPPMSVLPTAETIDWLASAIRRLPSDSPVPVKTPGYNNYSTQKDHWLGWLDPLAGTGTYPRANKPGRTARDVYNRIVEPKLLLWLISAAGVPHELVAAANRAADSAASLASKSAAVRRAVPWDVVVAALRKSERSDAA